MIYLADVRIPTEKAHGWQIVKMCEAFASNGLNVELRVPRRKQYDPAMPDDPFEYYGIARSFRLRRVADVDVISMEPRLPAALTVPIIQAHAAAWEAAAAASLFRTRPDLVYTRDLGVAACCSLLGLPAAYELHTIPGRRPGSVLRRLARRGEPRLLVALTPFIRDALIQLGFAAERAIVEGDAVDPTPFTDLPRPLAARKQLGLPKVGAIVGFAGRFRMLGQERGVENLIRAMVGATVGSTLVLVGGPMEAEASLRRAASEAGLDPSRLIIRDRVPNAEVPTWLRAFDVVAMPYPNTVHYALAASPLKLFEAMAAGVAVVATDLPSARLVIRDGQNGLLVPAGDTAGLTQAVTRLLGDAALRLRLASQAKKDVAVLTWEARAGRILAAAGVGA